MMGVEHQVKFRLRIGIHQSEYYHEQHQIGDHIGVKRSNIYLANHLFEIGSKGT